jgi:2-keto-4-pentenoate hydratase/2-oxohepta-3-ene-1,7-dioic acid hydratase in catechol pathway
MSYVFGYVDFIGGSARELPPPGNTFYQTKSRETFAPIGPWLVTADEVADSHNLQVKGARAIYLGSTVYRVSSPLLLHFLGERLHHLTCICDEQLCDRTERTALQTHEANRPWWNREFDG